MKPFTVLLLLPDYATGDFGHETYQAWVHAETAQEAKEAGQLQAVAELCPEGEDPDPPEDYHVLALYEGHHLEDVKDRRDPTFKCKYCGAPSFYPPEDQSPPPDYCHESDHGSADNA